MNLSPFPHFISISSLCISYQPGCQDATVCATPTLGSLLPLALFVQLRPLGPLCLWHCFQISPQLLPKEFKSRIGCVFSVLLLIFSGGVLFCYKFLTGYFVSQSQKIGSGILTQPFSSYFATMLGNRLLVIWYKKLNVQWMSPHKVVNELLFFYQQMTAT